MDYQISLFFFKYEVSGIVIIQHQLKVVPFYVLAHFIMASGDHFKEMQSLLPYRLPTYLRRKKHINLFIYDAEC